MSLDRILIVGVNDPRLLKFLAKLGYDLLDGSRTEGVRDLLAKETVDLVLLDDESGLDVVPFCQLLRGDDRFRHIPLVVLSGDKVQVREVATLGFDRLECIDKPYAAGTVASRIATQLRLRKIAGEESMGASLADVNAALRDHNAHLRAEREQARAIQRSLLPENLPKDARFDLNVVYRPLDEVGGDWYFVETLADNGRIALQIADVTGHGLSAAFVGSMTKLALRAAQEQDPGALLNRVNQLMGPLLPEGRFVTMAACSYDPSNGQLCYARAGHPPGLLLHREQGRVEQLMSQGFAIGFVDDAQCASVESSMAPGDAFVMLTDGISEAQNRSLKAYGFDRMCQVLLASSPSASAKELSDCLLKDVDIFREDRLLKDDVTLLILRRNA